MGRGHRQERVSEEIKKIISEMLLRDIKDPRLDRMISITGVDISEDLGYANVYITIMNGSSVSKEEQEEIEQDVLAGFESASGHIRKEVSKKLRVRHAPELTFRVDKSMEYGSHIDQMLRDLGL